MWMKTIVALAAAWLVAGQSAAQSAPKPPANDDCMACHKEVTGKATLHMIRTDKIDRDGNGVPSPNDTLRYTVTIINSGNSAASGSTARRVRSAAIS